MSRRPIRVPRATLTQDLHEAASSESIEYALKRARSVEHRFPMLGLIYRVVAEVLMYERSRQSEAPDGSQEA